MEWAFEHAFQLFAGSVSYQCYISTFQPWGSDVRVFSTNIRTAIARIAGQLTFLVNVSLRVVQFKPGIFPVLPVTNLDDVFEQ